MVAVGATDAGTGAVTAGASADAIRRRPHDARSPDVDDTAVGSYGRAAQSNDACKVLDRAGKYSGTMRALNR